MMEMGASETDIQQHLGRFTPDDDCPVLAENWEAVAWFFAIDDLFIESPFGLCLDIKSIKDDAEMSGRDYTPEQYKSLRLLGRECAMHMNKRVAS